MRTSRTIQWSTLLAVTALVFIGSASLVAETFRKWSDRTGQYSIEAELLGVEGDRVLLRRSNGSEVRVPISRLSDADRQYLATKPGGEKVDAKPELAIAEDIKSVRDLQRETRSYRSAAEVLAGYEAFMNSQTVPDSERSKAQSEIEKWRELADKKSLRLGKKWLTSSEIDSINKREVQLIKEAHRMIDVKSDELALERFEAASKVNPEEIRADYYLGLLYALVGRDPIDAEKHFAECVKRIESEPDRIVGTRRANYVASLNNLALTEVRTNKYDRAVRHWREALDISPQTPELVQNLGRLTSLGYGNGAVSRNAGRLAGELYAAASVANNSTEFDEKVGWLFMGSSG